jgi:hypothetical protein
MIEFVKIEPFNCAPFIYTSVVEVGECQPRFTHLIVSQVEDLVFLVHFIIKHPVLQIPMATYFMRFAHEKGTLIGDLDLYKDNIFALGFSEPASKQSLVDFIINLISNDNFIKKK